MLRHVTTASSGSLGEEDGFRCPNKVDPVEAMAKVKSLFRSSPIVQRMKSKVR